MTAHEEFQARRGDDGEWRCHCKSCDYVGPPRSHPLSTGADGVAHTKETGVDG